MPLNVEYLGTPSGILKMIEIVFVTVSFSIFRGCPVEFVVDSADSNYFGCGILVTCMIITPLLLLCYLLGKMEIQESIMEVALNSLFFVFLFSISVACLNYWNKYDPLIFGPDHEEDVPAGLALGSFTIITSIAYMLDTFFAGKILRDSYYGFK